MGLSAFLLDSDASTQVRATEKTFFFNYGISPVKKDEF